MQTEKRHLVTKSSQSPFLFQSQNEGSTSTKSILSFQNSKLNKADMYHFMQYH